MQEAYINGRERGGGERERERRTHTHTEDRDRQVDPILYHRPATVQSAVPDSVCGQWALGPSNTWP